MANRLADVIKATWNNRTANPIVDFLSVLFPNLARTPAEISAGVTPVSIWYPPGNVLRYGADPTAGADSTTPFLNACKALGAQGGKVTVPPGRFLIGSNLVIPASISIEGPFEFVGSNGINTSYNYGTMSAVLLSSTATITLGSGSGITGMLIYQSALSFPQLTPGNFAGTAIAIGGDDTFVVRSMLLGFNQCISCVGFQRPRFDYVWFDGVNGIKIAQCFDVARMNHCHGWPFVTVGSGPSGTATRTGVAYQIGDGTADSCDFFKPNDCFEYGYQNGFMVQNSSNVTLLNCAVDMVNSIVTTSVGFTFTGASNDCQMIGGTVSWQGTGVVASTTAPAGNTVKLLGVSVFNPQDTVAGKLCVSCTSGQLTAENCNFAQATIGVDAHLSSGGVTVNDCYFDTVTTPISVAGGGAQISDIFDNTYFNCTATIGERKFIQNQPAQIQFNTFGSSGAYAQQNLLARGSVSAPTTVVANDAVFSLSGSGYNGTSYIATAQIRGQTTGTLSGTAMPGVIVFSTTPSGSNTLTDGVAINGGGNLFPLADNTYVCGAVGSRWSITFSGQFVASVAASTVAAGSVAIGGTTASTVGAAGAATALPANPLGYLIINVGGTQAKIPYYNT